MGAVKQKQQLVCFEDVNEIFSQDVMIKNESLQGPLTLGVIYILVL